MIGYIRMEIQWLSNHLDFLCEINLQWFISNQFFLKTNLDLFEGTILTLTWNLGQTKCLKIVILDLQKDQKCKIGQFWKTENYTIPKFLPLKISQNQMNIWQFWKRYKKVRWLHLKNCMYTILTLIHNWWPSKTVLVQLT